MYALNISHCLIQISKLQKTVSYRLNKKYDVHGRKPFITFKSEQDVHDLVLRKTNTYADVCL